MTKNNCCGDGASSAFLAVFQCSAYRLAIVNAHTDLPLTFYLLHIDLEKFESGYVFAKGNLTNSKNLTN